VAILGLFVSSSASDLFKSLWNISSYATIYLVLLFNYISALPESSRHHVPNLLIAPAIIWKNSSSYFTRSSSAFWISSSLFNN
jgi:hypothetical protein